MKFIKTIFVIALPLLFLESNATSRDYQIQITKLKAKLDILAGNYSLIPDNLYAGKPGVRPGEGIGKELKEVLNIIKMESKKVVLAGSKRDSARRGAGAYIHLLQKLDINNFGSASMHFAQVYVSVGESSSRLL